MVKIVLGAALLMLLGSAAYAQTAPPVLTPIGAQSVNENVLLTINVSASDADLTTPVLSVAGSPTGASFTDNLDGTGTFSWIPTYAQSGSYNVTFYATDPIPPDVDSEVVVITVNDVPQAPAVTDIPDQTVAEGSTFATITLDDYVSDADNTDTEMTWTYSGNTELTVSIVARVATITIPTADWNGAETITFTATDPGLLADSDPATFTVTAANDAPVVTDIPDQTVAEGSTFTTITLDNFVSDIDNTDAELTWTYAGNTELTVNIDVNRIATITIPSADWNGAESITLTATDPGLLADSDPATFTVTAVNDAPVVTDIPDQTIAEGSTFTTISLDDYVSDVDNTDAEMTWTYSGNTELTVSIIARVATITIPSADWNGSETITFTATDPDLLSDSDPATFTVTAVGDAPVVTDIPDQTIAEGSTFTTISLDDYVSDVDNTDAEMTWTYSGNTELAVNIDINRVATITIPSADWNGSETITFTATDPGLLSDSDPATFTVTAVGDAPVVTDIPDQTIAEGASFTTITLDNFVSDIDNTDAEMTWTYSGNTALTVSIVARVATITTPSADWNGSEIITFTATDPGLLSDSDPATFMVSAANDAPVVTDIPDQTIAEGSTFTTITLDSFVSDIDNTDAEMTWTYSGNTGLTVSIVARVATITIPSADWNGSETITFTATDPGLLSDSDPATFTVTAVNDAPVLASVGPRSVTEGANLNFTVSATDVDGETPTITSTTPPANATFVDNGNGTGTFNFSPTYLQSGSYTVTFYARDAALLVDSEVVTITVNDAGNQLPVLASIGPRSVLEGGVLSFAVSATDIEDPTPALSTSTLPSHASFVDNGDGTGSFSFSPNYQQDGVYQVTFYATDDSAAVDFEIVTITVNEAGNQTPVLASIGPRSVLEGTLLTFGVSATDPDGTTPVLTASGVPTNASFVDNGNGTGNFSFSPDFTQADIYNVTFRASDGTLADSEIVVITVVDAGNRAPVLAEIGPKTVIEGATLHVDVSASDADGTTPTLTTSTLPLHATFVNNGDGTGDFDFNPDYVQSGIRSVTFYASDGVAIDSEVVFITIFDAGNQNPTLSPIGPQAVTEGGTLTFGVSASDSEGASPSLSTSSLPANASFVDNHDGTGTFTFNPNFTQAGPYNITFTATDDSLDTDFEIVTITVNEAGNQTPVLAAIGAQTTDENVLLTFGVSASDPDATTPALTTSTLPSGALFTDNGNGTGTFSWTPGYFQSGIHTITFRASDGVAVDSEIVSITVNNVNRAPELDAIGPRTVNENATLSFSIAASDPDLNTPALTATDLPANATFIDNNNGTGSFTFNPTYYQAGTYNVTFAASDGTLSDGELVTITVNNVNQAPVLASIGPLFVTEGQNLNVLITATDGDSTAMTLTAAPLPLNATFVDNGNGTGTFDFNPSYRQSGIVSLTFTVSDGTATDQELVFITINEAGNQNPVLSPIGPRTVQEGTTLNFTVTATDAEGVAPDLSAAPLPANATFVDNNNGTGSFTFTPDFTQAGVYNITFTATDDSSATDIEIVAVTVVESGNQAPVVTDIPDQTIAEGATFATIALDGYVSDADNTDAEMVWTYSGNTALTVSIDVNRVATITIPNVDWYGTETITFTATDPGLLADSDPATFTVTAVNDAPVVTDIPDQTIAEGSTFATIALDDYVSDIDNTDAEMTWTYSGNTALTVSIVARVATITIPSADWNGSEAITFTATDLVLLSDSDPATFTVTAVNDAPVVTDIPDQSIAEGSTFTTITLDNFVSDIDNTDAEMTWTYSGNTSLTVSIVARVATITMPSADWNGSETITFTATDPGLLADSDPATFTVGAANDAPVVTDIPDQTIAEGSTFTTITLDGFVSDIDNTDAEMTWTYSGNTSLTVSIVARVATVTIPSVDWNGAETITFTATDRGLLSDSDPATFTVTAVNDAPVVTDIPDQTIAEGATFATISLDGYVSDVDNTDAEMTWTYSGNTELTVSIVARVATITMPSVDWNGTETITFTATDPGLLSDSDPATFAVSAGNDAPVVSDIPDQTIAEGSTFATINLDSYVSDVDNTDAEMTWTYSGNTALTMSIDINRVATITIPAVDWNGSETVTFTATDPGLLSDSDPATFTVTAVDDAPVVTDVPNQTVAEGSVFATISLDNYVSDIDNTDAEMTWTYSGNTALTVSIVGRAATITIPSLDWNGAETITFTATDPGLLADSDAATFTVTAVADVPILAAIGPRSVFENANLNFLVSATDADNTVPSLSAAPLPTGANFTNHGDGTGTFDWTPNYTQVGVYNVWFVASDGLLADSELVAITVTNTNRRPIANAGPDQSNLPAGQLVQLDGTGSSDPDSEPLTYSWVQVAGLSVTLSGATSATPTFTPVALDTYRFELTVFDGIDYSLPDTVSILVVNGAPPQAVTNFTIQRVSDELHFTWSPVTLDITGLPTTIDRYVVYRGTSAYFTPSVINEIGTTTAATTTFTDNNIGGANVVGDTLIQYFYVLQAVDAWENVSALSNRVGEYDYQILVTPTTDYNLVAVPFTGTGITTADQLISAIGTGTVLTVNRYVASSQSFQSRFAAGFGTNFAVVPGGIYQVNAAAPTIFTVVGNVPAPGSVSYPVITTATTDYNFLMVPFDREADFTVAQNVIDNIPGVLNTLNNFVAVSQSYQSRFAAGFGVNFTVRAGKPYQANAAAAGTFPQ